jgi:hypothetical protein
LSRFFQGLTGQCRELKHTPALKSFSNPAKLRDTIKGLRTKEFLFA